MSRNGSTIATYDAAGSLTSRFDTVSNARTYLAYTAGTHRLCGTKATAGPTCSTAQIKYDMRGNASPFTGRTLTYAPFNLPQQIVGNGNTLAYVYDHGHRRIVSVPTTRIDLSAGRG